MNIIKLKQIISEEIQQTLSELNMDTYSKINRKSNELIWSNKSVMNEFDINMFKNLQQIEKQDPKFLYVSDEYKKYYYEIKNILKIYKEHGYDALSNYEKMVLRVFKKSKGGSKGSYLKNTSKALAERDLQKYINKPINFETNNKLYKFNISKIELSNRYSYLNNLEIKLKENGKTETDLINCTLYFDKSGSKMNIGKDVAKNLQFDINDIKFSDESIAILNDILKTAQFEIPENLN